MQLAPTGPFIQRLNVFYAVLESITTQIDFILRNRIEHERVIRIWRMAERKDFRSVVHCSYIVSQHLFAFGRYKQLSLYSISSISKPMSEFRCGSLTCEGQPYLPVAGRGWRFAQRSGYIKSKTAAARCRAAAEGCIQGALT